MAEVGPVEAAALRDIAALAARQAGLDECTEAATALALAREMDSNSSATSKSMVSTSLNKTMEKLREMAPAEEVGGKFNDLRARRSRRRAGGPDPKD